MESLLSWIGVAFGALFVVAVAVAWWEHVLRSERPESLPGGTPRRAVSVDVSLDELAQGDAPARRAAMDETLARAGQASGGAEIIRGPWIETRPMVGPGPVVEPARRPTEPQQPA